MKTFTVKGTWEQIGRALGEAQRVGFAHRLRSARWKPSLRRLVARQTAFLKDRAPGAFALMQGLAEGTHQPLETIVAVACWEYLFFGEHCSTYLGEGPKGLWIAHNEDAHKDWRGLLTAVRCVPRGGVPFVSLQYAGTPPGMAVGVNRAGFAISMNDLHRARLPAVAGDSPCVAGLRLLQARSWKEVEAAYCSFRPNAGMHFLVAGKNRARSLEMYWDHKAAAWVNPGFMHTNHPLLSATVPGSTASRSSRERLARLAHLTNPKDRPEALKLFRFPFSRGGLCKTGRRYDLTHATVVVFPAEQRIEMIETQQGRPTRMSVRP